MNHEHTTKVVLKTRYFTPEEAKIKQSTIDRERQHVPVVLNPSLNPALNKEKNTELDGFLILETAKIDFPEDVQYLILSGQGLRTVVQEDLTYFTGLFYLDLSENSLPFVPFGALPKLIELRMACNNLQHIEDIYGFNRLMYLDLSYNSLSVDSILALSVLPALKELDLCGNNLSSLPSDLSSFSNLEKLLLQYNKFDNNRIFQVLSTLPNIRHLDLSHNYLSVIPKECCEYGGFRLLEVLDIAFNFFNTEESIESVILLNRLKTLILYGNPVLGPTGEDPMFIYVEDLIDRASQVRKNQDSSLAEIEFITEIPRKRTLKKGHPLGRYALYRDFSVVQVNDTGLEKSWKKGNTPFGEAMSSRKMLQSSIQSTDFTFITSGGAVNAGTMKKEKVSREKQHDDDADVVMQKIAWEMGLIKSDELELFENYTNILSPRTSATEGNRKGNKASDIFSFQSREKEITLPPAADRLPKALFDGQNLNTSVKAKPMVPTQPIALRAAMRELQKTLEQPLTNYDEVPSRNLDEVKHCQRSTTISKIRQIPRRSEKQEFQTRYTQHAANIIPSTKFQKDQQNRTFEQINSVLDDLNFETERTLIQSGSLTEQSKLNGKKSLEGMRTFAKPQSVRGLVNMVQNIIQEFNS